MLPFLLQTSSFFHDQVIDFNHFRKETLRNLTKAIMPGAYSTNCQRNFLNHPHCWCNRKKINVKLRSKTLQTSTQRLENASSSATLLVLGNVHACSVAVSVSAQTAALCCFLFKSLCGCTSHKNWAFQSKDSQLLWFQFYRIQEFQLPFFVIGHQSVSTSVSSFFRLII